MICLQCLSCHVHYISIDNSWISQQKTETFYLVYITTLFQLHMLLIVEFKDDCQ